MALRIGHYLDAGKSYQERLYSLLLNTLRFSAQVVYAL